MLAKAALWTFTALAVVAVTPFRLAHAVGLDGSSDSSNADARRSTSREPTTAVVAGTASVPAPLPDRLQQWAQTDRHARQAALWTFTALAVVAVTPFRLAHAVGLDGSSDSSNADARRSTSREPTTAAVAGAASAPPPLPPPRASTASAAAACTVTMALHDDAGAAARMSHDVHRIPPSMSPLAHSLDEDSELEDDDWQDDEPRGRSRVRRHYSPGGLYSSASASLASASSPHKTGAALSAVVLPARTVSLGSPGPLQPRAPARLA
ncbi:hypothetical protein AMAG_18447 [Allomyces macrogynus ATCC 38327]|uniref:Uncharacterized protein n=1 Tax=Allomyces macrogynus (strain ATCC 38327) TaxID=578462 RepID=A0A0L0SBW9_ALLM3|nr:hypothetical protein AMAG_18447 [Allomyces macrogynus ATCC 38327]|eukprot:KNE59956.1 hypothetical protein AMAG_18447 [Allomyces macrogynus ATCC 38327]